jgi:serine/threonine protein kinase/predicted Zn-dependent protease
MVGRIGRYEITGKLGDGGFGSVYRGYDPTVERVVAIKVLSTQGDASLISRFRTEAMTAGNLHHKNIVTIYEFGEDNGAPFIAMEYLDGVDLQKIINNKSERESLTLLEKLEIMSEAAQGLHCAHEHGVVHRDVKPANIMRLKDGSVKIMDFGIARLTNTASTRLTKTGLMIGTVYYMAPEQFKSAEVDALCDIWSYGVVFYELLTGIHPFRADDPAGVMYRVTMEEPQPVSSLVPNCPPALAANLHRLLSKDRHERIQSLDDFVLDTEPIIASLAKIEIPELLKRAERLIQSDNVDGAQVVIGRLRKLDRSNKEARQLNEHLRERVRLQTVRPKIDALVREAEERANSRDFAAAVEKLNSAMRLDPGSPTLRSRLEQIKEGEDRAKRGDDAISRGRRSLNEGDLTGAFTHLSEAVETDPGHDQAGPLLDEVKRAMHEREIQTQVKAVTGQANDLILIQAYDDAISLLSDLADKTGSDEQVVRRLLEARQLKQVQEIKDRLNAGINASRELLKHGRYEQACKALEELDRENPNSPAIEVLLAHAGERLRDEKLATEIENHLTQARGQRASGRFDEALQCVKRALELDRTNAKAMALQRICLDEQQADRDRKKVDAGLEQYQSLVKEEKLEEALALADRLAADHPGEPRIAGAKVEAEERIKKREEALRLKVQKGIHEAERLLADARPESATRLLANLTIQYPAEAAVNDLLDRAQRLKLSQEAQDRLNAGLNSVQEFLTRGTFVQACQALEDLDRQYPQNPAIEVLLTHARERMKAGEVSAQIDKFLGEAQDQRIRGRFDPAIQSVERALELDPENTKALALKATLLEEIRASRDRGKIASELEKLQVFLRERKLDQALVAVDQLATLFPQDQRVVEAKRDIAKRIRERDEERARKIRAGINEAERMLADGQAGNAIRLLENLTSQFPDETSLPSLVERARQLERDQTLREEIRKNLAAVREFVSRREWDRAVSVIGKILKQRPDCREYIDEAANIQQLRLRDQELSAVEDSLENGPIQQAISMAEAALAKFPGEPRAAAALQNARNLRELNDLVAYARRRVANGDLEEAAQLVADGRARFPYSGELREIENSIEKARGIERSLREARLTLQGRRFAEARKLLNSLLRAQSENAAARQLLAEIDSRQKEYERQQAYDRGRSEADQLIRSLQFGAAIEKIQQLLGNFPSDAALREDLDRACAARDQHARRESYSQGRAEAQALSGKGSLDFAIARIRKLLEEFPGDGTLIADLGAVQAADRLRDERVKIDAIIGELDALFRKGDAEAVRCGARELLSDHKEPRAAALLDWAEKSIAQTREIRKESRPRRPILLWGTIAGLATIAAVTVLLWLRLPQIHPLPGVPPVNADLSPPKEPSPTKSPQIKLQPEEMVFTYVKGGLIPQPKQLHIETGGPEQNWQASSGDSWLLLSIAEGFGTSDLITRVDPSRLSVAQYSSFATVTSGLVQKTLRVTLRIEESPKVAQPGPLPVEPAPPPPKPEPPPLEEVQDCHSSVYTGRNKGIVKWEGELAPGAELSIFGNSVSPGSVISGKLPGCAVSIKVLSEDVSAIQVPSEADNFRAIRLTNKSGGPLHSIQIEWLVK